jgi:hypothetical protein
MRTILCGYFHEKSREANEDEKETEPDLPETESLPMSAEEGRREAARNI